MTDHQAQTITSLCDRLERIHMLATTGDHMDISKRLREIAGLSGGFLTPPTSSTETFAEKFNAPMDTAARLRVRKETTAVLEDPDKAARLAFESSNPDREIEWDELAAASQEYWRTYAQR